ncbi:MAG: phage shock protein C [Planctomycetota bacterium]|jgi:phage shock protein C
MAICDHCKQDQLNLIAVADHAVCRNCIEALSAQSSASKSKLHRKREGKQIAGICAGLAEHVEVNVDTIRVAVVLLTIFSGFFPGLISYAILTYFLPVED